MKTLSLTTKLFVINACIFIIVGGILLVVHSSFSSIQSSLTTIVDRDVNQVISNAQLGRELNAIFGETRAVIRRLYEDTTAINDQGIPIIVRLTPVIDAVSQEALQATLRELSEGLHTLFQYGTDVQDVFYHLQDIEDALFNELNILEETIAEELVVMAMQGEDTLDLNQISTLVPRYREALLNIDIQLTQIEQAYISLAAEKPSPEHQQPQQRHPTLFLLFKDLILRLRPLETVDTSFAEQGQELAAAVERYEGQVIIFLELLRQFHLQHQTVNQLQNHILTLTQEINQEISQAAEKIQTHIGTVIGQSRRVILGLSAVVFAVLIIGWLLTRWMTAPLNNLSVSATQLAEGNLEGDIPDTTAQDEIGTLSTAFKRLTHYFQEMAHTATELSHGKLDLQIHARSEQDVFGNRFRQMITYLKHIGEVVTQVAQGDLRSPINLQSQDDQLGNALIQMQQGLISLISEIRLAADHLSVISTEVLKSSDNNADALNHISNAAEVTSSAMQQVSSSAEQVRTNTERLSSSVEETSASIAQMISSIKHVAQNSRKLSEFADNTSRTVDQIVASLDTVTEQTQRSKTLAETTAHDALTGQQSVEQMISKMQAISGVTEHLSTILLRLEHRSQEIGTILDVINEVADQTSLLALNASIIAAQAGDHGRGFAVVADEIKDLATRVGSSTQEINEIVKNVQRDSSDAAQAIEQGKREVEIGGQVARQAGQALKKIGQSSDNSSQVTAEIAVSLRQQTTASIQIADSIRDVAKMITEITQATKEQENNSSQLFEVVEHMQTLAAQVLHATQEQQTSTRHVTDFMQEVITLVDQSTPTVQQLADSAQTLASQAELLKTQVKRFMIPPEKTTLEIYEHEPERSSLPIDTS
ncbi:HAMP domain-containing protein [candidate division KSB3 bacterium]|uniref:HAMP domain-containing protein n=1 Tax=candidate division KSB3 bacterium TaxID=2044937 RepID=A0A9D5JU40_9BACT|nr:HAMP domain-containing protein [candidate division KSB3 bacterium]MBD3323977.1 HAMP domain-containing protein [candidate division KSB3 bacterium]